jgi:hypothetical protein
MRVDACFAPVRGSLPLETRTEVVMQTALAKRIDELVEIGWEPVTTTETSASLVGRRPFSWWLFLLVIVFFPFFGGILYLIFWLATSRATVFLHEEANQVHIAGDTWLVSLQESQRAAMIEQRRQIRERGFLAVMWPQLLAFLVLLVLWVWFLRWYF